MKTPSASSTKAVVPPIFVYGTLMHSQVVSTLLNRTWPPPMTMPTPQPTSMTVTPARLYGYRRHPVKDRVFPAIVPSQNTSTATATAPTMTFVQGLLLAENALTETEMTMMDWYEGDEYSRVEVTVESSEKEDSTTDTVAKSTTTRAQVWIWREDLTHMLDLEREWSYEEFCDKNLEWYLEHTVRPCRAEMERLCKTEPESSSSRCD